jgi:endonuclease/exonuclease/phosphatase (EEP) superfamily protein YafD
MRLYAPEVGRVEKLYLIAALTLVGATLIPFLTLQHWTVRWFDFAKIQICAFQTVVLVTAWLLPEWSRQVQLAQAALLLCWLYNLSVLLRYTPWWPVKRPQPRRYHSDSVSLLSANVLQFNTDYQQFLDLVAEQCPDIVLTMESNEDWDTAMRPLEAEYPHFRKVPLENTYGMHLYSKLPMETRVHYLVADDLPSIEAKMRTREGYRFTLWCLHPPPPSPTEEPNSKERDGELLAAAKRIRQAGGTTVVVGDFNNVAWARSSVLFRKTSETIDPRIGRGLAATFHARYWFARFPIDQLFHSPDVFAQELRVLRYFGSDHLPLYFRFYIDRDDEAQEELVEELEVEEHAEVEELIEEGIAEEGQRDEVATE